MQLYELTKEIQDFLTQSLGLKAKYITSIERNIDTMDIISDDKRITISTTDIEEDKDSELNLDEL
ncbi:hypothetical protein DSECCO2_120600 [anaerobic digester metagenome]